MCLHFPTPGTMKRPKNGSYRIVWRRSYCTETEKDKSTPAPLGGQGRQYGTVRQVATHGVPCPWPPSSLDFSHKKRQVHPCPTRGAGKQTLTQNQIGFRANVSVSVSVSGVGQCKRTIILFIHC